MSDKYGQVLKRDETQKHKRKDYPINSLTIDNLAVYQFNQSIKLSIFPDEFV